MSVMEISRHSCLLAHRRANGAKWPFACVMIGGDPHLQSVSYRGTSGRKLIALLEYPVPARSHRIQSIVLDEPGEHRLLMLVVQCREQLRKHHEAAQVAETVEESQRTLVAQRWSTITSRQTMSADQAIAARYLNGGCRAIGNGARKFYA